jgi:hypothetical protein
VVCNGVTQITVPFDIPNGWAMDERNWAIIVAAQNMVETAEQVSGGVDVNQVQEPNSTGVWLLKRAFAVSGSCDAVVDACARERAATNAELAWHFFGPSMTSGYMYYVSLQHLLLIIVQRVTFRGCHQGEVLDMPVKQTVACNSTCIAMCAW